ncbi:MAG: hypothetical protein ABEH65_00485 [Halobacteriales archaeon]
MGALEWGIVVLAIYPLLQIPAVWYLSRRTEMDEETRQEPRRGYDTFHEASEEEDISDQWTDASTVPDGVTACASCGAHNDVAYAYCRDCTARLA